ncbi:hypothetical protein ASC99_30675 [Kitasatospora sp. Root107]|nr:hypothetical protein ASC99_30675 [Kitasatospora sp. Root107]
MPLDAARPEALAATARALAPGFAAICLTHTHPAHTAAVRAALAGSATPVVDTASAHATATLAAALNALTRRRRPPEQAVVALVGAHFNGDLVGLLHDSGVGELILYAPTTPQADDLTGAADLLIDLTGTMPAPSDGTPVLRACPQDPPPLHTTDRHPHPLHVLPTLVAAAARGTRPTTQVLLATARALAALAEDHQLLPPAGRPGLTQGLTAALAAADAPGP